MALGLVREKNQMATLLNPGRNGKRSETDVIRDALLAIRNVPSAVCEALGINTQDLLLSEFDVTADGGAVFTLTGLELEIQPKTAEFVLRNPNASSVSDECRLSYLNPTKRNLREAKGFIQDALHPSGVDGVSVIKQAMADSSVAV